MSASPTEGRPAREAALAAIRAVEDEGAYSNLVVPQAIADLTDVRDRGLAAHLAYETLRWRGTLDWALGHVLSRPMEDVEPGLVHVLRLGATQLLRTDVPPHAAVSTTVDLARSVVPRARAKGAAGFVNGVLRALARTTLPWPAPSEVRDHLRLTTAHPAWIVDDLLDRFERPTVEAALMGDNSAPGLTLRATGDRNALVAELRGLGHDAEVGDEAPESVRVPGADPRRLAAVTEGRAVPQDEASMVVVHTAGVQRGDRVLDLCAGPGGKASHLAHLAGPGRVTAIELHEHRAALVREVAQRTGTSIEVRTEDARHLGPPADPYDHVLLDAPCTGLGTGRRRPEVRWRRGPEDVASLQPLQRQLLDVAARQVAVGGAITYAVCTWTRGETVGVIDPFLVDHGDRFVVEEQLQLLPGLRGTDGMFVARLRRSG